jgi:hypothetical protein
MPPEPGAVPAPEASPVPGPEVPPEPARARLTGRLCPVCQAPLTGRQARACSGRCRAALSRQRRAAPAAAEVATLRQRVAELEAENQALRQTIDAWVHAYARLRGQQQARVR